MAITTQVDIVSATQEIFSGIAEKLVATAKLGEVGIMPGHAPFLALLKPGEVRVTLPGGEEQIYYISGGMLEVQASSITVLADSALRAQDLDEAAAITAKKHAEDALANKNTELDYSKATAELARAVAQIRAIQKFKKHLK